MKKISILFITFIIFSTMLNSTINYFRQTCFKVTWTFCDNNNDCVTYTAKLCWDVYGNSPLGTNKIEGATIEFQTSDNLENIVFKAGEKINLINENNEVFIYQNINDVIIDNQNYANNVNLEKVN